MIPRLKEQYYKTSIDNLSKKFHIKNKLMAPKILKVVLNMGLGKDGNDKKKIQSCLNDMSLICGQKPVFTKFKKSISNFKTRKGSVGGIKVTLRKNKMYEFIDRLVNIALKDGNYSLGIKEHIIFPEINFDTVDKIRGMDITIVISNNNKEQSLALLEEFNFPFMKKNINKKEIN